VASASAYAALARQLAPDLNRLGGGRLAQAVRTVRVSAHQFSRISPIGHKWSYRSPLIQPIRARIAVQWPIDVVRRSAAMGWALRMF
jgi:hypothetical protein